MQPVKPSRPLTKNAAGTNAVALPKTNRVYSPFESTTEEMNVSINFENNKGRLPGRLTRVLCPPISALMKCPAPSSRA